ncbi:hypothetical protein K443DRAFT_340628 [Laccaria amethystina LaAM-08-1]|uniref:Uncharacterized protein n=1 Tax=Laccaria amethystina LaAM-08-1 TaxID=1095629 RepID=A0A0C9X174_9AGAR|nr:hypothetical protein K443DRAFT_340628 [Laccaria amethystina LaAM-08-1]
MLTLRFNTRFLTPTLPARSFSLRSYSRDIDKEQEGANVATCEFLVLLRPEVV